jgi:hypothetical protein
MTVDQATYHRLCATATNAIEAATAGVDDAEVEIVLRIILVTVAGALMSCFGTTPAKIAEVVAEVHETLTQSEDTDVN